MRQYTHGIGGMLTLRTGLISRIFALLLVSLILSPFNAPFATFDPIVSAEITQGDGEAAKVTTDAIVDLACASFEPGMRHFAHLPSLDISEQTDLSSAFHMILRI